MKNPGVKSVPGIAALLLSCFLARLAAQGTGPDATGPDTPAPFVVPHVTFSVQPSSTPVSAAIKPVVRVRVVDKHGVPLRGRLLTMSLGPNPPNPAVLSGVLSRFSGHDLNGLAAVMGTSQPYQIGTQFFATEPIRVVPSLAAEDPACRQDRPQKDPEAP